MISSTPPEVPARTNTLPRTQYIFIDCENVCEADLSRVVGKAAKVFMVLGSQQKTLPVALFLFVQKHPEQLRVIQTPVQGRNALDFVLTLELGRILAADPNGYFHIVSKDTDFNAVVSYLKAEKKLIARRKSLTEVPALWRPEERLAFLRVELANSAKPRPATRRTLENRINSAFENKVAPDFIEEAIEAFVQTGILDFTDAGKIIYKAA
jgi:hypothetical protein